MIRSLLQLIKASFSKQRDFYWRMAGMLTSLPGNLKLYEIALIHKSASAISKNGGVLNNERLEYLGDAILDAIIADYLYSRFPQKDEGFLTQLKSKIVKRKQLNRIAVTIGISDLLVSNTNSDQPRQNLLGNAFEALIGAVYIDKGYRKTYRFVVHKILKKHLDLEKISEKESDFKSRLIEWSQKNRQEIRFESREEENGAAENNVFVSRIMLSERELGRGKGPSKKDAEQNASRWALENVREDTL